MKSFDDQYQILNSQQRKAVDVIDGPVFVMAGPGTGKTQILTLRIANILKQGDGIEPENILALTFTNAAAYNMRERLAKIIGPQEAHRVYISTFHSFAEDMIKRYPQYFERFIDARLISTVEQYELLAELCDQHGGEYFSVFKRRQGTLSSLAFAFGKIKNEALDADELRAKISDRFDQDMQSDDIVYKRAYGEYKKGDLKPSAVAALKKKRDKNLAVADIYEAYQASLQERKQYDYADLIISVVKELHEDSLFQTELQEQFQYILVDEHQDTNDGQNAILHALIDNPVWEGKPNVFVVGDAKQSIFRFAGASEKSFVELFEKFKDVTTIELESNYRSHQGVLDYAQNLITKSSYHKDEPTLEAYFDYQGVIEYREFHSYKTEALWVASDIKHRIDQGEDPSEIAVLFRNNKDAQDLRLLMDVYGVSYQDHSKKNLLEDPDMLKLFLLLRSIYSSTDDEVIAKALFIDFLDFDLIGVQKVLKAFKNLRDKQVSLFEMIADEKKLAELKISKEEQEKYQAFVNMVLEQKRASENTDFISFFSDVIRDSGFLNALLSGPDSARSLAKVETLFDEIKKEALAREEFSFDDFITYLNTLKEHGISMNVTSPMLNGVQLMTFHGSKGLEFDTVYIVRALKKRSVAREISLPFDEFSDGSAEDERRLMYVAMTRAKKNCLMSSYVYNQEGKEQSRSLHIDEIDDLTHIDMSTWEQDNTGRFADFFGASQQQLVSLIDHNYIQERFLTTKLSVSALNNYIESPLLYFFRNLVLLPQARSPFLDFGNLIHGSLELYFNECKQQGKILGIKVLEESFNKVLESNYTYRDYQEKGWNTLEAYFDHYHKNFELPVENEFRVPAVAYESPSGQNISLTGVIDKITRDEEGNITVWDYKTGRAYSAMDKGRKEKLKRQATFYKLLLQNSFSGKYNFHKVVFDFIEADSATGDFERKEFEILQEDVDALILEINQLIDDIFSGSFLEKDFSRDTAAKDYLELLEILKGPRSYEQPTLID
jgi:DNA helicase-2/ATP-dependent DNA helicase PcrA